MSADFNKDRKVFEYMLIILAVGMTYLFYRMGAHRLVALNLFFLPVVLSGYYLGRASAGVLALLCAIAVSIAMTLDATGFAAYNTPVMIGLVVTVWAAVLGLTALLVGTLCDERATKVDELHDAYIGVVEVLSKYLQSTNPRLKARSVRVAELSEAVALEMRLPRQEVEDVRVGALLQDVGNIEISTKLITKAVDTLEENPQKVENNTFHGMELVHSLRSVLRGAVPMVVAQNDAMHDCLASEDAAPVTGVPIGAKIIRAARDYDQLTAGAPSGASIKMRQALQELRRDASAGHDPAVLDALERVAYRNAAGRHVAVASEPAYV
jgi:HD-GYP domain-containing protein (c-di-GMP phosphodiesterase class II)